MLIGILPLVGMAFSRNVREKILHRDGCKCVQCGATEELQAAHIDHNKANPRYNDPSNGRTLCLDDHLTDHILRHGRNGLTKEGNLWAIDMLRRKINRQE